MKNVTQGFYSQNNRSRQGYLYLSLLDEGRAASAGSDQAYIVP